MLRRRAQVPVSGQKAHQLSVVGFVEGAAYECGQLSELGGSWCGEASCRMGAEIQGAAVNVPPGGKSGSVGGCEATNVADGIREGRGGRCCRKEKRQRRICRGESWRCRSPRCATGDGAVGGWRWGSTQLLGGQDGRCYVRQHGEGRQRVLRGEVGRLLSVGYGRGAGGVAAGKGSGSPTCPGRCADGGGVRSAEACRFSSCRLRSKNLCTNCSAPIGVAVTTRHACARRIPRSAAAADAISGSGLYAALFEVTRVTPTVRTSVARASEVGAADAAGSTTLRSSRYAMICVAG
jgi:hypothetical protein